MFPLESYFSDEIKRGLVEHFYDYENDHNDDVLIGDIDEIASIYSGIREENGILYGSYNDDIISNNHKVAIVNVFKRNEDCKIQYTSTDTNNYTDLLNDFDYIQLIKTIFDDPVEVNIKIDNFENDKELLKEHVLLLQEIFGETTDIVPIRKESGPEYADHSDDYKRILKDYWGHDSFRDINVYNQPDLDEHIKNVETISQETVISELVDQVERCGENKNYSDMFVTAPTGAGKSVMFQIPAIYLAEKYNLLTIVISPLIGLMNDQVKGLEDINYKHSKTINSDISPIIKNEITEKIANSEYHILYISPETLLSRSDVEYLIGDRTIGMIVIDEAHIVTTWGKQFRPDYWYLGDHISMLRKKQQKNKQRSFIVAAFTATAIYGGIEDMYQETVNSLHLLNPIVHLGYVKRDKDIIIKINQKVQEKGQRYEYELEKLKDIEGLVDRAKITNKKILIYFPTIASIDRCYDYLKSRKKISHVCVYFGTLDKDKKDEYSSSFRNGEKLVMLATKAFGMGIDINDIAIVAHFAPTGNVCDYVQEIGRAARKENMIGEACYSYHKRDFKYINRLHGLSAIQPYHLVEVIKKIYELYENNIKDSGDDYTRKRNAMLIDAENFSYIFNSFSGDESENINKVKTALLLIQKDFENTLGFSPINAKPIPLFATGFFEIDVDNQKNLRKEFGNVFTIVENDLNICRVNLDTIWNKKYNKYSFPKFKYLLYSHDPELDLNIKYKLKPALCVDIVFEDDYQSVFNNVWNSLKEMINKSIVQQIYLKKEDIINHLMRDLKINKYKASSICDVVISSIFQYMRQFYSGMGKILKENVTTDGKESYRFDTAIKSYFDWVDSGLKKIRSNMHDGSMYVINDKNNETKKIGAVLGVLESLDVLSFKMIGGANSQIYIYINQIQKLQNIVNAPYLYENRLLEMISKRHKISVLMLTYLYENDFTSDERWQIIENYFLGDIPESVMDEFKLQIS